MSDPLRQELLDIFVGRATRRYGLSAINQLQHALQAATLAEADGAPPATVLASLLHDVGHMIHQLGEDPAGAASTTCMRSWALAGWPNVSGRR
jgi:predicted HD phosphohydrolase